MSTMLAPRPPFRHLLVPLDGSLLAEAVLPVAVWVAQACGARLTLLHVIEHDAPETVHGQQHLGEAAEASAYLATVAARLSASGPPVDTHVHPNEEHDVPRAIAEHAREFGTDLIALTTHGSSGLRGLLAGSIAQQVLGGSDVPVLVARPGTRPPPANGALLVALDGGAEAEQALPVALLLAEAGAAPLHLLRVVRTAGAERGPAAAVSIFTPSASAALLEIEEQVAGEYLTALVARCPAGIVATAAVRRGEPADEIVRVARDRPCRMLLATTHGKAGLESIIAGSVIPRALPRLTVPLLLLRLPERSRDGTGGAPGGVVRGPQGV